MRTRRATRPPRSFDLESMRSASCHAAAVEALIADAARWPSWQPEIISTEGPHSLAAGDEVAGRASMLGFEVAGRAAITDVGPGFLEEDAIVGVRMRIRYEVIEAPGGCRVVSRMSAELPGGVAGRILSLFLRRRLRWMQETALTNLVAQSEAEPP